MENFSHSSDIRALSEACGLLRLQDPDFPYDWCDSNDDDDDDDPLSRPEITVKINDNWTVSSKESSLPLEDAFSEDSAQGVDEVNADNNDVASFINVVRTFPPRRQSSSDDEEHVVPSITPIKVSRLDKGNAETKEELNSEEEREEDDAEVDTCEETTHRHRVEKETEDRSNPQPP